jgi:hypothetical protein
MKPVLKQEGTPHYVSESEMIKFISENAPMDWNKCCDFVRKHDITGWNGGVAHWDKTDIIKNAKEYNEEQVKWVGAFFEAHPWLNAMVLVFDD